MEKKKKLALFDLDGTLFDTFEIHYLAYMKALNNKGVSVDREVFKRDCFGKYYSQFLQTLIPGASQKEMDEIHDEKKIYFDKILKDAVPNTGLFDIIKAIKPEYYLVVVTSSYKEAAIKILKTHGVYDLFDAVIGGSDVIEHKPAPDCYQLAQKLYNIDSKDIIVFEDTQDGCDSAKAITKNIFVVKGYK